MLTGFRPLKTRARAALAPLLAAAIAALAAGCGSSGNGVSSKSANEIMAASKAAANKASSARVATKVAQGKLELTSHIEFASNGGHAQVSFAGLAFEVLRIGSTLYVKGNRAFESRLTATASKKIPEGTWIKASASGTQLAQLAAFTDKTGEMSRLLSSSGPLTKGSTTTVNGQKAIELKQTAKLYTGSAFIATTGEPYPIQLLKHGRETGETSFSDWNQPVTLTAPTNSVEVSQLEHEKH
jgi:hypothetical protein